MRSRPPAAGEAVFFLRPATLLSTLLIALAAAAAAVAAGAESPWLSITAPERVIVLESGRASEAVVALELENRHHKRVRVEDVRIVYLDGARVLRTETPGRTFFDDPVFSRSPRIEAGAGATWRGLCLADPPPGADRVRFEIDLASRGGRTRNRNTQAVAVELVPAPEPVPLSLPFEGYWKVTQGHGCSTNHRAGALGGELAWDFAAIGGLSGRQTGDAGTGDALTFGARILSPADGRVVRVVDGVPDNRGLTDYPRRSMLDDLRQPEWIFGNFIVIEIADGGWVLLAHLQQDSIEVQEGQPVTVGQIVGRGGNSGNSIEAHLHVQVMNGADPANPGTSGIPAVFVDYTEFTAVEGGTARDLQARRVEAGDPPEQSVVIRSP